MAKCSRKWGTPWLQLCLLFDLTPFESGYPSVCLSVSLRVRIHIHYFYSVISLCFFFFQQFMPLSSRFYGSGLLLCLRLCCFTALYSHITEHHQQQQQQHTPTLTHTRATRITLFIVIGSDAHFSNKNQKVQNKIHEKALTRAAYTQCVQQWLSYWHNYVNECVHQLIEHNEIKYLPSWPSFSFPSDTWVS